MAKCSEKSNDSPRLKYDKQDQQGKAAFNEAAHDGKIGSMSNL
jgi:hypothetical protein